MGPITILFGVMLIGVGMVGHLLQDPEKASWTALIPAYLGGVFVLLGVLALRPGLRKHVMHVAAVLGLLGVVAGLGRLLPQAFKGELQIGLASICISLMTLLCAVFVALCVNSFIQARRRRARGAPPG